MLDNCMGSGSTGVACVNTKRNFIGIELDKEYFEVATKRINDAFHENTDDTKLKPFDNSNDVGYADHEKAEVEEWNQLNQYQKYKC